MHNSDGSFRWTTFEEVGSEGNATTPRRGIGLTHLQLVDVDRDGVREIVYGTQDGWIYAVKPQDGAEVWHANVVGEVVGLIAFPCGLVAASEFGELYAFSYRGELRWHVQIGEWIRGPLPRWGSTLSRPWKRAHCWPVTQTAGAWGLWNWKRKFAGCGRAAAAWCAVWPGGGSVAWTSGVADPSAPLLAAL